MKTSIPPLGESSTSRSTRTDGASVAKRWRYSSVDGGGIKRSSKETLMLEGGTTGCGEEGTEVWRAWW